MTAAASSRKRAAALAEPIVVGEFWANRSGNSIRVQLYQYDGIPFVDVRRHYTDSNGKLCPTPKGFSLPVRKLPELAAAVGKAFNKAHQLGLIIDRKDGGRE